MSILIKGMEMPKKLSLMPDVPYEVLSSRGQRIKRTRDKTECGASV